MSANGDEESEWEYEYDENETEDFYVVLEIPDATASKPKSRADDLFAAHDPTKSKTKAAKGRKRKHGTTDTEANNENDGGGGDTAPADVVGDNTASTQPPLVQEFENLNIVAAKEAEAADTSAKGLQIMDLASDEPMIMYQGQMYSCKWATSLGSDLLFMRRPENPGQDYKPLRSFKDVDLLSIATAKLIASPAIIERKPFTMQADPNESSTGARMTLENEDIIRQARFLGRIADIKIQRGEPVGNLKSLANTVLENPDGFASEGRKKRGGRVRATVAASPRRKSSAARTRESPPVDQPTIASTRSRRASTQSATAGASPAALVQLDDDEEMVDV